MITMGWAVRRLDGPATSVNATQVHPRRSMRALARAGRNWGQDARLVSASNHFQMPLSMSARLILRLEGLGVLTAAIALYASLNTSWWLFAALLLAPNVFMIGYLAGPRLGALLYNMGHTYVAPLALGALAYAAGAPQVGAVAVIWAAHIGMDRALGYGLKQRGGFHDTHLSRSNAAADSTAHAATGR